ncbi:MAG: ribosome biogenesis GTP-binding protein YihA/YsxC [Bernardetiaceae bacterium]
MKIKTAQFYKSSPTPADCPPPDLPEYAFIGRSNVGKSSLINFLVDHKGLAKTSGTPGKTQLINHFLIDQSWYLVDLPGYGFVRAGKRFRDSFEQMIRGYLLDRQNLIAIFVLLDIRHPPQKNDLDFMTWLGEHKRPFFRVFTKADKLKARQIPAAVLAYDQEMSKTWAEVPPSIVTSSEAQLGREEILGRIAAWNTELWG